MVIHFIIILPVIESAHIPRLDRGHVHRVDRGDIRPLHKGIIPPITATVYFIALVFLMVSL